MTALSDDHHPTGDDNNNNTNYRYTVLLNSKESSSLATTGGKGCNLSILSRNPYGIPIPPGFVVTVRAYLDYIFGNPKFRAEIEQTLQSMKANGQASTDPFQLEEISKTIREAFARQDIHTSIYEEIRDRLQDLSSSSSDEFDYVAVRSSATCEDMPDASFAGQHDTYLNVNARDIQNVYRHVIDCFASLFTSRAIAYRERNGLPHLNETTGMAVVVQAMVMSQSSGVLFTVNPLTGRRTESVLEAIPGLGEALVSGLTEPDRYVVSTLPRKGENSSVGDYKILDTRIGAKLTAIRPKPGGGVVENEQQEPQQDGGGKGDEEGQAQQKTAIISDATVLEIIDIGKKLQTWFDGKPQDIEWARSESGTVYVVQSRPVTTLFPLPNDNEFTTSTPAFDEVELFSSFGAVQGFQAPWYPQGQDTIRCLLGGALRWITWGRKGTGDGFFRVVAGRLYSNFTRVVRNSIGRKFIFKLLSAVEPGMKAGIEVAIKNDPDRIGIDSGMTPFFFVRLVSILSTWAPRFASTIMFPDTARAQVIRLINREYGRIEESVQRTDKLSDLIQLKQETFEAFFPSLIPKVMPRILAGMFPWIILTNLSASVEGASDLAMKITRGLPHNVTTEMDLKLWNVATVIRRDEESLAWFHGHSADDLAADYLHQKLPQSAQNIVSDFLNEYGMRGLYEIDFGRQRWREYPVPLMQTLKSYIDIDEVNAPDKVFAGGEKAAEEAITALGQKVGKPWLVSFLARRVRAITGLRELPKFTIIRIMGLFRQKLLSCGKELVAAGVLDAAEDLFLLHDQELIDLAAQEVPDPTKWKGLVADRKATMERENERTRVPKILLSDGFGFYGGAASTVVAKDGDLVGEPVSPGSVEGRVRVVLDPSKTKLLPGEVLVCHGTDPSWTPLFLAASALVMEVGGLMTHGSVVAREYGIPAVVGLEKVTERLKTGQRIRVDGSSGIVEILPDEE